MNKAHPVTCGAESTARYWKGSKFDWGRFTDETALVMGGANYQGLYRDCEQAPVHSRHGHLGKRHQADARHPP